MKYCLIITAICLAATLMLTAPGIAQSNTAASQIDAFVDNNQIILSDQLYTIANNAVFYARDEQTQIDLSRFSEGDWVEFSLNVNGEIEEMWFSSE